MNDLALFSILFFLFAGMCLLSCMYFYLQRDFFNFISDSTQKSIAEHSRVVRKLDQFVERDEYELSLSKLSEMKILFNELDYHVRKEVSDSFKEISSHKDRLHDEIHELRKDMDDSLGGEERLLVTTDQLEHALLRLKEDLLQQLSELKSEKDEKRWESLAKALSSPKIGAGDL